MLIPFEKAHELPALGHQLLPVLTALGHCLALELVHLLGLLVRESQRIGESG
jgi:hypothetical protein